ncbi:hypothetical protein [Rhodoplanes azumiensis]|uniref:Secreted protein n=1 Tax=Rhodoplanes azumiensis TaxID=1897628 RepID=A0ABW5AH75_9BRAD
MRVGTLLLAGLAGLVAAGAAQADTGYPVSGRWTYKDPKGDGPAPTCDGRVMTFSGMQRFDTGGGVSQFRNVRTEQVDATTYRVLDEFFNVMIRGKLGFELQVRDPDHIAILLDSGEGYLLRRCGTGGGRGGRGGGGGGGGDDRAEGAGDAAATGRSAAAHPRHDGDDADAADDPAGDDPEAGHGKARDAEEGGSGDTGE